MDRPREGRIICRFHFLKDLGFYIIDRHISACPDPESFCALIEEHGQTVLVPAAGFLRDLHEPGDRRIVDHIIDKEIL